MTHYDCLVIGAGFAGAVVAGELARRGGRRVLVLERRDHVGGNAYDRTDEAGVLIHQYGPHIFHTNSKRVYDYLSQYTTWNGYEHKVAANIPAPGAKDPRRERVEFPVPFNLTSMELLLGRERAEGLEKKLLAAYGGQRKVTILELRRSPDPEIARLAQFVYESVFVHYTMKQWGQKPEEIDPATTGRVPVLLSRDDRYFQDTYQGLPTNGYTALFEKILRHPNITLRLGTDAKTLLSLEGGRLRLKGDAVDCPVVYTGALDAFFDWRYGRLPYRTLDFRFETWQERQQGKPLPPGRGELASPPWFQSHGTINYTMDREYTRITEFKHMTLQKLPHVTTIVKEYSRAYTAGAGEIPYYAVINPDSLALYARYKARADELPNLYPLGRLAEYKYYNMDAIVERALVLARQLLGGFYG